jgi:hypothetical protein
MYSPSEGVVMNHIGEVVDWGYDAVGYQDDTIYNIFISSWTTLYEFEYRRFFDYQCLEYDVFKEDVKWE